MSVTGAVATLIFGLAAIAGYLTHVVWTIHKLSGDVGITLGQTVLGVLGTLAPPLGVLHGWLMWLGLA